MTTRRWLGLPAVPWLLVAGLAVTPVLRGEAQFFYRDVTRQYEPLQAQLDRAWRNGELPTWNASTQGGVPLLANLHAGVFAPWTPLFRALPFHRAYGLSVALAWAAWMTGLFVFLRRRVALGAAVVGAATGGFTGVVLGATSYLPLLAGLACIPWQLAALEAPRGRVAALGALFALQVLAGDPSTVLMGGVACLLAASAGVGARGALRHLLGGAAAGAGLAAVQLLPAWTLYGESARATSGLEARLAWSFHPARVLEWFVRRPFGGLLEAPFFTRWDLAAGPDAQPFFLEHGWGLLGLLTLGAALVARGPLRRLGLALVGAGLVLSLGKHLGPLQAAFELPPLALFRFPERYGALAALGASLLAGHGAAALLAQASGRRRWAWGWLGLAVLLGASSWTADGALATSLRSTAALLALAGAASLLAWSTRWAWLAALLAVGALDAVSAMRASVLTLPAASREAPPVLPPAGHRLWRENGPLRGLESLARGRAAFEVERAQLHATFASATPGLHGVDELGGYSPVSLRRWQRVIQATAGRPELLARLFDVCAFVSTAARGQANPGWAPLATLAPDTLLFESKACAGRAWTVSRALDVRGTEAAVEALQRPGFDPATMATREEGAAPLPPLQAAAVTSSPRVRADTIELEVAPREGWALVVVSETWAPGWEAWVDDEARPVERLDGALLGVAVPPAGRHVRLVYAEPLLPAGAGLSVVTVLVLAWLELRRRAGRLRGARPPAVGSDTSPA